MDVLQKLLHKLYERVAAWVNNSSPATIQLTGILGLALVLIGYYHFKGSGDASQGTQRRTSHASNTRQPNTSTAQQAQIAGTAAASSREVAQGSQQQKASSSSESGQLPTAPGVTPLARAVFSKLHGVRRVTVSCPGVLLQQWQSGQLTDCATLWPGVADLVKEMCNVTEVYLISQVSDDIGEALVSGALEAAGVTGSSKGQLPSHRLLFCSTLEGKVAMARQLEPELHIDSLHTTIDDLRRFVPQLWHVKQAAAPAAASGPNIASTPSLAHMFGL